MSVLPDQPIYHLLWSIPESFGGLTHVCLKRATMLSEADKRRMDILTLAPNFDAASRQEELRSDGLIGDLVQIRNLWSELRSASDEYLRTITGAVDTVVDDSERTPTTGHHDFELLGASGEVLQTARFRSDGSLLATDRLDVKSPGQVGGRRVTLYSESGDAISQWRSATAFYAAWIEAVLRDEPSIIVCDSAFVGGLFAGRKFDQAKFVQVLHSHHRDNTEKYYNSLAQGKLAILSKSDFFDKVAVLTDRQYKAIRDEGIASDNFSVISNTFNGEIIESVDPRRRGKGIIVARLSGHKQIDHAITAVRDIDVKYGVTLDIFGTGDGFSYLAGIVKEDSLETRVSFHGYHPDARANFRQGSFSLLTSKSEGQGLVLLESMAAGCIPIAYDIEFGPSDIISHGIDGFLVPPDDKMELARTIQKFMALPEHEVEVMREAAVSRASEFSAEAITSLWGSELKSIAASPKATASGDVKARLVGLNDRADGFHAAVEIEGLNSNEASWCKLAWVGRKREAYGRAEAKMLNRNGKVLVEGIFPDTHAELGRSELLDLYVDTRIGGVPRRARIESGSVTLPAEGNVLEMYSTAHGNVSLKLNKR